MQKQLTRSQKTNIVDGIKYNLRIKKVNVSYKTMLHISIISYILIASFPFIFAFFSSFKDPDELVNSTGLNIFPKKFTTDNYTKIFGDPFFPIGSWIFNSVIYSLLNSTINIFVNMMIGFALARIAFRGKKSATWYFLISLLIPAQLTQYPQFFIMLKLGFIQIDSYSLWMVGILFASFVNLYNSLMARQYFVSINNTVEEAATIDGLRPVSTFFRVSLRMAIPLIATQWSLVFLWSWNNFIMFKLFAMNQPELKNLVSGIGDMAASNLDRWKVGKLLAGSIVSFVPVITIYVASLLFQRKVHIAGEK